MVANLPSCIKIQDGVSTKMLKQTLCFQLIMTMYLRHDYIQVLLLSKETGKSCTVIFVQAWRRLKSKKTSKKYQNKKAITSTMKWCTFPVGNFGIYATA